MWPVSWWLRLPPQRGTGVDVADRRHLSALGPARLGERVGTNASADGGLAGTSVDAGKVMSSQAPRRPDRRGRLLAFR